LSLRFTGRPRNSQLARMRFDAFRREAREHLLSRRADEIRTAERRTGELALERDALQTRIADLE